MAPKKALKIPKKKNLFLSLSFFEKKNSPNHENSPQTNTPQTNTEDVH
jgi:hypothetical protein